MPELQDGIAHAPGKRPGSFFAIIFLQATREFPAQRIGGLLADLWGMYEGLKVGRVRDLDPEVVPHEDDALQALVGFGLNMWGVAGAQGIAGIAEARPAGLVGNAFRSPAGRGGPLLARAGLHYADEVASNPATEHVCIQLTAQTKLAVDRGVVETWKLLLDNADAETGVAPLSISSFYLGFQRSDRRSWIDFHDGLSNLEAGDRATVIAVKPSNNDEDWCLGGTYLTFIRLAIDLPSWRRLTRTEQELLVGRDKLSGCPLTGVGADRRPQTNPRCPIDGTPIWDKVNDAQFAEPPSTVGDAVALSHVQRANHHNRDLDQPRSGRIFRQGYEFLEWQEASPGFRLGLNFVSFQDDPSRVLHILGTDGWLGNVNFGGDPAAQPPGMTTLLKVYAAGIYFVPPKAAPFPGASAFGLAQGAAEDPMTAASAGER
jgi:deferrochelatase/peroxidase EfeB